MTKLLHIVHVKTLLYYYKFKREKYSTGKLQGRVHRTIKKKEKIQMTKNGINSDFITDQVNMN